MLAFMTFLAVDAAAAINVVLPGLTRRVHTIQFARELYGGY